MSPTSISDLATLKIQLGISTGVTGDDTLLTNLLTRAENQIEQYCKRVFDTTTSGETRYYNEDSVMVLPRGSQWRPAGQASNARYSWDAWPHNIAGSGQYGDTVLWLDKDLLSIVTLTNGDSAGTVLTSTEYWLEPRNRAPYEWIRLRSGKSWVFDTDGEVSVNGIWGYSTAAPATVVQATLRLAEYHYRRRDVSEYAVTANNELGTITVPAGMPEDVVSMLKEGGFVRHIRLK